MSEALNKLRKLKGRSLAELRVRGAQAWAAYAERGGWSSQSRMPSDAALLRMLLAPHGQKFSDAAAVLEHFRRRTAPPFFASFDRPAATRDELHRRFGGRARELAIERARRISQGRFDLLGFRALSFGEPVDWHLEPVSGKRAPLVHWSEIDFLNQEIAGDKKITWELNRHQYFITLGRAYWHTGDELFARTFVAHLGAWMDANPPKLGINWASSLEAAFRSIAWLWSLHLFRDSPALTPEIFLRALKFLHSHARHLETYLSIYFSPNTHLTGEALGLFYLGTLLPEFRDAARWRATGQSILLEQLDRQVHADGVYFEQSSYYQRYTTDFYTHFYILLSRSTGDDAGAEKRVAAKLKALLDHLMHITRPDGTTPFLGDDDGGRLVVLDEREVDDFRAALSTGAALFGRADYKHVAGEAAEETLWLLGVAALESFERLDAQPSAQLSRAFPDGGYYVMRDGWTHDSNYFLIDCGAHGTGTCGHAHADALSFELAARGRTLLVDSGTYTYTGSAEHRDAFRTSAAHNTLTIDGESSSVPDRAFTWKHVARAAARRWTTRERFDFFEGEHDGYARLSPPATHARSVFFIKRDYWILRDRVATSGAHRYDLHFHFAAGASPFIDGQSDGTVARQRPDPNTHERSNANAHKRPNTQERPDANERKHGDANDSALDIFTFGKDVEGRVDKGWVSRCYGERTPAPVVVFSATAEGAQDFITLMLPRGAHGAARAAREVEAVGGRAFEVSAEHARTADAPDVLLVADGGGQVVETARFASDFEWTWARFNPRGASELDELILIGGSRLKIDGGEVVRSAARVGYVVARRVGDEWLVETDAGEALIFAPPDAGPVFVNGEISKSSVAAIQTERSAQPETEKIGS